MKAGSVGPAPVLGLQNSTLRVPKNTSWLFSTATPMVVSAASSLRGEVEAADVGGVVDLAPIEAVGAGADIDEAAGQIGDIGDRRQDGADDRREGRAADAGVVDR